MTSILSTRTVRGLLATSTLALLPQATLSIALLVHAAFLTGSVAQAGLVSGAYAAALGVAGPLVGRVADGRGQTGVLVASTGASTGLLVAVALLPGRTSVAVLIVLAAGLGVATPPVAACLRAALPDALSDPGDLRTAVAFQATLAELAWITGPPLTLGIAAAVSTRVALLVAAAGVLAGTAAFTREPASRAWRPTGGGRRTTGAMRAPGMRTLVAILTAVGVVFGAVEVGIATGQGAAAGPLLGLWGAGSLIGGAAATRFGGGPRTPSGLAWILAALAAGHLALALVSGSAVGLGLILLTAGAAIAPTYATVYAMVDDVAPAGTVTEASAWLATAVAVGAALGSAAAGVAIAHAGTVSAYGLAGLSGAVAVAIAVARGDTLGACSAPTTPGRSLAASVSAPAPG
ncbi:MAG TPA: MFS transporter [Gaiellales bacterium]|nr:MFS transporter [Gaiellales bacterium]